MKSLFFAFLIILGSATFARAEATERVLGPIVLVERSYSVDLAALKNTCKRSDGKVQASYIEAVVTYVCKVEEFKLNGTESYTHAGNAYISYTVGQKGRADFYGYAGSYVAVITMNTNTKNATFEDAMTVLDESYRKLNLDTQKLTLRIEMVREPTR